MPATSPVTVQRRASNSGVIMVVGQKIALGRIHARKMVSVRVSAGTITIEISADDIRTVRRTTDQPIRNLKASVVVCPPPSRLSRSWSLSPGAKLG
jgi:hypothetical protein